MSSSLRNNLKAYMESVGDLVIVVDDILPFLANVHLYKKRNGPSQKLEQHVNNVLFENKGSGDLKGITVAAWDTVGPMR